MTNIAVSRRDDDLGDGSVPSTAQELAKATGGNARTENQLTALLKSISSYIPTEAITLYLAALAAVRDEADSSRLASTPSSDGDVVVVTVFFLLIPIFVWLVYAGRVKTGGKTLPLAPSKWPLWEMVAATVAFGAWSFALPDSPFMRLSWHNAAWSVFVVLAVSTALGLLAPILQRTLKA